jgi:hypothetical protein
MTVAPVEEKIVTARRESRGQDWIGAELGVSPRTGARVLRHHRVHYLRKYKPMTGDVIRASRATTTRYERDRPRELVHMDVEKLGKNPGRRRVAAYGRAATKVAKGRHARIVDDRSSPGG